MTNEEIEKYKQRLIVIVKQCNELRLNNIGVVQKRSTLDSIIDDYHKLAIDVCAPVQFDKEIIELKHILEKAFEENSLEEQLKVLEAITMLYYQNILYTLQTEMMLNACVSAEKSSELAKRSCRWAAIAAIAAGIGAFIAAWPSIHHALVWLF